MLKTLTVKLTKLGQREKEYSILTTFYKHVPSHVISLSLHILILNINFLNVEVDNGSMNQSTRLLIKRICCTSISPFFWSSCV